jgi:hypothetical protein
MSGASLYTQYTYANILHRALSREFFTQAYINKLYVYTNLQRALCPRSLYTFTQTSQTHMHKPAAIPWVAEEQQQPAVPILPSDPTPG